MRIPPTAALLALAAPLAFAAPVMQPGLYEISMQMVMPGMPMQMPVMSFRNCITAKDIADGNAYARSEGDKACKVSNLRQNGSTVSYDFACAMEGGRRMAGHASGASHATGYDVMMNGRFVPAMEGMSAFNQKMHARRIGACQ